jgi:PDZ domain-containing protein
VAFDEYSVVAPLPKRRLGRGMIAGIWALSVALVVLLVITFLPTSYVIEQPGPVYNTLGTAAASDGTQIPLISVEGAETFETEGTLDLLTVQVRGDRQRTPSWLDLAIAWFDPSRAVVPIDQIFPEGQTTEERSEQSAAEMVDSQKEATAAALKELGYDVVSKLTVHSLVEDSAAEGVVEEGDVLLEASGVPLESVDQLRGIVDDSDGAPIELLIERDGEQLTETVTPTQTDVEGEPRWLIGVILMTDYEFPIDVTIQLNNVGGPSAGMMFALGIVDTLTPGALNGGEIVAGTGTITADGTVGPIGGIRQKMWGAVGEGADWMLAPSENCDEVVGHIPPGLRVFSVDTLDDAIDTLDAIRGEGDLDALPTCTRT